MFYIEYFYIKKLSNGFDRDKIMKITVSPLKGQISYDMKS
jgi:hypothetical protein